MTRPGPDQDHSGVSEVCRSYFGHYITHHGKPPGRNHMVAALAEAGISRERVRRDWRILAGTTDTKEESTVSVVETPQDQAARRVPRQRKANGIARRMDYGPSRSEPHEDTGNYTPRKKADRRYHGTTGSPRAAYFQEETAVSPLI